MRNPKVGMQASPRICSAKQSGGFDDGQGPLFIPKVARAEMSPSAQT